MYSAKYNNIKNIMEVPLKQVKAKVEYFKYINTKPSILPIASILGISLIKLKKFYIDFYQAKHYS